MQQQEFIKDYNSTQGNDEPVTIKRNGRNAKCMSMKQSEKCLEKCPIIIENIFNIYANLKEKIETERNDDVFFNTKKL